MGAAPPGSPTAAFPQLGTEFVDENRQITIPWYRLIIMLWRLAGGQNVPISNAVYFVLNLGPPAVLEVFSIFTGDLVGVVQLEDQPGLPAVPLTLTTSPFVFTAAGSGTITGFAGKMELSRDGGTTYYPVTLTGGAVPMLKGDKTRISWSGATAPIATWFPSD